jgi:tetratricopeptide (TPR) repeat protein
MVPYEARQPEWHPDDDPAVRAGEIMDSMDKMGGAVPLAESVIVWRAQHTAWNAGIRGAEPVLSRLIKEEGSRNPQAMDLLARVCFQQGKYDEAMELWNRASELQPGNPSLRRAALAMNDIAESPSSALLSYRLGILIRNALLLCLLCLIIWKGVGGVKSLTSQRYEYEEGHPDLAGRFHYEDLAAESMPDDFAKYIRLMPATGAPAPESDEESFSLSFNRRNILDGKNLGRIDVTVRRAGSVIRASGRVPDLYARYLVEQRLWAIQGVTGVDVRELSIDRSYQVGRGDNLWLIAKKIYGQGNLWPLIAETNGMSAPGRLKIGQELSLPLGAEELEEYE